MLRPTLEETIFIALFLEGFLFGLYSGIFAMYLQYRASKQDANKKQNISFYSICALYVLSAFVFGCDMAFWICQFRHIDLDLWLTRIRIMQATLFACCDFIAQFILIYRCWIVWGQNMRIVIIPSILAFAFFVIWIVGSRLASATLGTFGLYPITLTGIALSLTVNALVTGLIVFRIFKVFRGVKATPDDNILLGATGKSKLRRIILVLIESAMVLFSIQLARLVVSILNTDTAMRLFGTVLVTHQMLNGITPTIILVRTLMGLSFHDEKSMEEFATGSLRFASNHPNSPPETGSICIVGQDTGDDDDIDVQLSNDIDVVRK